MRNFIVMAAHKVSESVHDAPAVKSTIAALVLQIVAVMQSAQTVASTLTALFTSVAGVVVAYIGLRKAWKNRDKE